MPGNTGVTGTGHVGDVAPSGLTSIRLPRPPLAVSVEGTSGVEFHRADMPGAKPEPSITTVRSGRPSTMYGAEVVLITGVCAAAADNAARASASVRRGMCAPS